MEAGILTVTAEDKPVESGPNVQRESAAKEFTPKEPLQGATADAAKAKDAKPAAERKRTRNLSEDKRFKLFSGTANKPLAEKLGVHGTSPEARALLVDFQTARSVVECRG